MGSHPIVVQKYGGSSLADAHALRRVAQALVAQQRAGSSLVVVVSAMGQTTNALLAQATEMAARPPQRELDMLVTAGERICMALLSMAVQEAGAQAVSLTGSQSGIITENSHQGARILAVRPTRILAALEAGHIVIVAGYQGVSLAGEVTTLGRGGSDTTAVALGAALGATHVEIYSDVDGVYSADPRLCPQARHLGAVPYQMVSDLSHFGAKVLHEQAVAFAERAKIALWAAKTGDTTGRRGVVHATTWLPEGAQAVADVPLGLYLSVPTPQALAACLAWAAQVPATPMVFGAQGVYFAAHHLAPGLLALMQAHAEAQGWVPRVAAAVSAVGQRGVADQWQAMAHALEQADIAPWALFGQPRAITVLVAPKLRARAVVALHTALGLDVGQNALGQAQ